MGNAAAAELIGRRFPILDKGYVELIDVMGDDHSIVDAARLSYGKGTRKVSDDRALIRYLMRNHHGTPFEMCEIKIGIRMPMDSWRQMIRHRTASVNEYSTRYSEAIDDRQCTPPGGWRSQSSANRQGSGGLLAEWPALDAVRVVQDDQFDESAIRSFPTPGDYLSNEERLFHRETQRLYRTRLAFGVAREQARKDLPLSTYTEAYWKCDLRNVFHFLGLRMDAHAQAEIRAYADVIGREVVAPLFPLAWEAFEDYVLNAVTLSAQDVRAIRALAAGSPPLAHIENVREREECRSKLDRLGLADPLVAGVMSAGGSGEGHPV